MLLLFAKWLRTFRIKCLSHMIIHSTSIHYWSPICGLLISGSCQFAAVHYWSQERILWGFLSWSRGHMEVDWFCVSLTTGTREGTQGIEKGKRNLGRTRKVHWAILNAYRKRHDEVFITRDSEVIMFSPCVFVCVYVCHDFCQDDLTMKDWCHTNNILQVYCWGCLIVQVMFHALMTSLVTSQGHKVGQIFKSIYLRQYFS